MVAGVAALLVCLFSPIPAEAAKPHPRLGDTLKTWVQDWGPYLKGPDSNADHPDWKLCPDGTTEQITTEVQVGEIVDVSFNSCDISQGLTKAAALAEARMFFPKDTVSKGTAKADSGTDQLYYSASLGKTEPAKVLSADCNENSVKPGLFTVSIDPVGFGWEIGLGTCT
jgi:hypothetical protein